jgi:DNA-binding XRE family transcriptional regulator
MFLAGYILDTQADSGHAIEVATKWMYEAEKKRPNPKMQFLLAFMYQKLNNEQAGNYYLNKSCSHESLREQCRQFKEGLKNETSCSK